MKRKNSPMVSCALGAVGLLIAAVSLFPLLWLFIGGFKSDAEVLAIPFRFFPKEWVVSNYTTLFSTWAFPKSILLSLTGAAVFAVLVLLVNSMAAYVFARLDFPGKRFAWSYVIMTMFIPSIALLIPSFVVVSKMGMLNTLWVLILPGMISAANIFFLRQFYLNVPSSLEEAALIDGSNRFLNFWYVFIPMSGSVFVIVGVGAFMGYWNAYLWPVMTISDSGLYQIMQLLAFYRSDQIKHYGVILAGSSVAAIPTILLFLVFQRYIIQGIKIAGLK